MKYISTRNTKIQTDGKTAVLTGLAEDGGLYVPSEIPKLPFSLSELSALCYDEIALGTISALLPDIGYETVKDCVRKGYAGKFDAEDRVLLKEAGGLSFLELYHGPTSAFKDMALCLLPRLLTAAGRSLGNKDRIVILTATSGDTGKAALEAFSDVPGTVIIVFYPAEGVSDIQRLQMQTQEGKNVHVLSVRGNFDDAQNGVKKAFSEIDIPGIKLCSANSINVGRLVPQVAYYFFAYGRMACGGKIKTGEKVDFAVPTGNFGDIFAGWIAKKMGLPVGRLLCASNKNNVLTDFINTGVYDRRREFYTTESPSMDILVSSNLERLLFYACGMDPSRLAAYMEALVRDGMYKVGKEELSFIRDSFDADFADEEETLAEIKRAWDEDGYLLDPHTAVASACARRRNGDNPCVVLSTASPYKFAPAVLKALGRAVPKDCFEAMKELEYLTKIPQPSSLSGLKNKKVLFTEVIEPKNLTERVRNIICREKNSGMIKE